MIYTNNTEKAMKLAYEKHKDMVDKTDMPYIIHPILVADKMPDEDSTVVALLHDVVEDTDVTIDNLKEMGFNDNVIGSLKCLTHEDGVDYLDYIRNVAKNPIARKVKIADIEHNSDLTRVRNNPELIEKFSQKYPKALEILKASENDKIKDKYLPIGTVVMLKGASKKLMITGYCAVPGNNQSIMFDYAGCMFPEGFLSSSQTALFNHSQIEQVFYSGYENEEEQVFNEKILDMIQAIKDINPIKVEPYDNIDSLI